MPIQRSQRDRKDFIATHFREPLRTILNSPEMKVGNWDNWNQFREDVTTRADRSISDEMEKVRKTYLKDHISENFEDDQSKGVHLSKKFYEEWKAGQASATRWPDIKKDDQLKEYWNIFIEPPAYKESD